MSDLSFPMLASFAILGLVAFIGVMFSLRRNPEALVGESEERVVALLREQYDELESEHKLGKLSDAEFQTLQAELAERLKEEVETNRAKQGAAATQLLGAPIVLGISTLFIAISIGLYVGLGSPSSATDEPVAASPNDGEPEFMAMIASLERRLNTDPNDPDGWRMLGRSYRVIGQFDKSVAAYQQAMERGHADNVEVILDTVEALTLRAESENSESYPLMAQLLAYRAAELDGSNPKALWYAHIAAANTGDIQQAVVYLEALRDLNPPAQVLDVVNQQLKDFESAGATLSKPIAAAAPSKSLTLTVALSPELSSKVGAGAQLYVFAKSTDGSPIPVAVWRGPANELPATITLNDSLSLMPNTKFSAHDEWLVTARISQTGDASANPGDLYGESTMTEADNNGELLISEVVE